MRGDGEVCSEMEVGTRERVMAYLWCDSRKDDNLGEERNQEEWEEGEGEQ